MLVDDLKSYKLMFEDMENAGYHIDEYWKTIEYRNQLKSLYGLNTFRDGSFSSYSAISKKNKFESKFSLLKILFSRIASLEHLLACRGYKLPFSLMGEDVETLRNWYGHTIFRILHVKDKRISEIVDSGLGNPADKMNIGGKIYTHNFLRFFHRFTVMNSFYSFENINYFLEIGGSYGGQIEVLLKLYPHMRVYFIEIPPQLYVAERYLNAVFPGEVVNYQDVRKMDSISRESFNDRKIILMTPWQLERLGDRQAEAFTNQFSFQEMSRDTVETYCKQLQRIVTKAIFLFQIREGHPAVSQPVRKEEYIRFLCPRFILEELVEEGVHETVHTGNKMLVHNDVYFLKARE